MLPTDALSPPATPLTDHATAVFEVPVTAAEKVTTRPTPWVTADCSIETTTSCERGFVPLSSPQPNPMANTNTTQR
jgi:hypothetical protein